MGWVLAVAVAVLSQTVNAAVFERYLHADRPADRAILGYLELERQGTATSRDLAELGVLLLDKGFPKDAERYLRKAVAKDRDNFEAIYRLGLVLQRQGEYRKAIRCYKKVVAMRPGHGYARFMLALAEEKAGRRQAAIRDYARAFQFVPELADYAKNPLLYDSALQTSAQIERYRREVESQTLAVTAIDPAAVARMKAAAPTAAPASAPAPPAPTPTPAATPAPAPATPAPPPGTPPAGTRIPARGAGAPRQRAEEPLVPGVPPTPTPPPAG